MLRVFPMLSNRLSRARPAMCCDLQCFDVGSWDVFGLRLFQKCRSVRFDFFKNTGATVRICFCNRCYDQTTYLLGYGSLRHVPTWCNGLEGGVHGRRQDWIPICVHCVCVTYVRTYVHTYVRTTYIRDFLIGGSNALYLSPAGTCGTLHSFYCI